MSTIDTNAPADSCVKSCVSPLPEADAVRLSRDGKERVVALATGMVVLETDRNTPTYRPEVILCQWPQDVTTGPERLVLRVHWHLWDDADYRMRFELLRAVLGGEAKSWDHARTLVRAVVGEHRWARLPDDLGAELDAGTGAGRASLYAAADAALGLFADRGSSADREAARQALLACAEDDESIAETLRGLAAQLAGINRPAFAARSVHLADLEAKVLAAREPPPSKPLSPAEDPRQPDVVLADVERDRADPRPLARAIAEATNDAVLLDAVDLDDTAKVAGLLLRTIHRDALRANHPGLAARVDAYCAAERAATVAPSSTMATEEREMLGREVRRVWVEWADKQPDVDDHHSWLVPWERLAERDREVDRLIGEAIAAKVRADIPEPADLRQLVKDDAVEMDKLRAENQALRNTVNVVRGNYNDAARKNREAIVKIRELEEQRLTDESAWDWLRGTAGAKGGQALVDRVEELRAAEQALVTTRATLAEVEAHRDELDVAVHVAQTSVARGVQWNDA